MNNSKNSIETKKILYAITKKLHEVFGDSYNIEIGEVKQGFETPCFFVKEYNDNRQHLRGNRYHQRYSFRILAFAQNDDIIQLYNMKDKLYQVEYIQLENKDLLRCINKQTRIDDKVLQFMFDINMHLYLSDEEETKMENSIIEGGIINDEKK